ncbi:phosphomannomutase [Loktanella sp. IMCC34160]|uniref:phosphomannomutase n=1 Tax=Loktanella sp. IMCC34160 TaxID=2510646 RepID=UPI00101CF4A1|nr:phosphomannomutase [Loktanella sp. IMCC34160]RYG92252.1 phosphomannomutase [Loktanella sp. IMCC34160]
MPPKFGTSGLRGLVTELTPELVADYTRAFLAACDAGTGLCIGRDLRPSSPDIAAIVARAAAATGLPVTDCGALPTPALAQWAMGQGQSAIMVTGSHIPADRNGLKFYTPAGEITKRDEAAILAALGQPAGQRVAQIAPNDAATMAYRARYVNGFGPILHGARIGLYAHSAVGRDVLADILTDLGAAVVVIDPSDKFIPVDTEAVDPALRARLPDLCADHALDALVSTDGDSDRPFVADAAGQIVPGDILGQICVAALGADTVVTPVSSNSSLEALVLATRVIRTRIGSPYVIDGMQQAGGQVVGYEANGGFLLGFDWTGPEGGVLAALPTRDAVLPILIPLWQARLQGAPLSALVAAHRLRVTATDRLPDIPTDQSARWIASLTGDSAARAAFLPALSGAWLDLTDGLRMHLDDGRVLHLRPSGNAPELRVLIEAPDAEQARAFMDDVLPRVRAAVSRA